MRSGAVGTYDGILFSGIHMARFTRSVNMTSSTDMRALTFFVVLTVALAQQGLSAPLTNAQTSNIAAREGQSEFEQILSDPSLQLVFPRSLDWPRLRTFYAMRHGEPAWTGSDTARENAMHARAVLASASDHGLDAIYDVVGAVEMPAGTTTPFATELILTDRLLRYVQDVSRGRVQPDSTDPDRALPLQSFDAVPALAAALTQGQLKDFLTHVPPPYPGYERLAGALARYREIAAQGGWPTILPGKGEIEWDGSDERLALLRKRLNAEDVEIGGETIDDLQRAVLRYQARNGLVADGRVGPKTLGMLNVPVTDRIAQIVANMERWRWLPRKFEDLYIFVQLPDGVLRVMDNGHVALESKVIFGRPHDPTPVLRAEATSITVNPPWNVPRTIAVSEILPLLRRHSDYLVRHNMVLLNGPVGDPYGQTIDWTTVTARNFRYRVQQLPGPDNALDRLKLEMPNRFVVYLHDTPHRSLFSASDRALSHGCVRVEQILPLASFALTGDVNSAQSMLQGTIATEKTTRIDLPAPLPVYLLYWTAIADADGLIGFRPDIYQRDKRLTEKLARSDAS